MVKSLLQLKADAASEGWAAWIRSESDERAVLEGHWFDSQAGKHWVEFFERWCYQTMGKWAGQPFTLLPWQRDDIIMPLFGWKRDRARPHLRRYTKGDIFVAKKNGKSTLAAGLANAFLLKSGPRAEVYGVAHTKDQASIIYREAAAMAEKSPMLSKRLKALDTHKRIVDAKSGSFYQALAGENNTRGIEGINPVLVLFDEIHVQRSRAFYDALAYASAARDNALFLSVSTVGVADQTTIWWEQYEYAKGIINGTLTDHARFAYVRQADEDCLNSAELRMDRAQWLKANPSLGETVIEEKLHEAVIEAENSPAKLNNLLRYRFNIPTAQVERVVPIEKWRLGRCKLPDLEGRLCYAGLDVASTEDLAALVLYFPPEGTETHGYLKQWFWCPAEKIAERERKQMAFYRQWVKDGWLTETEGNRIDHKPIYEKVVECSSLYRMHKMGFDKWNADAVINPLMQQGIEVESMPQTLVAMSTGTKEFLKAIEENRIKHDGSPVMDWCLSNTAAEQLEEAIKFSKKKSAEKIDGAVAGAMAFGMYATYFAEAGQPQLIVL